MSLQTPLVLVRWIVVVLAVLAWLVVVPILELIALGYRSLVRAPVQRGLRAAHRLVPVAAARANESPATRK